MRLLSCRGLAVGVAALALAYPGSGAEPAGTADPPLRFGVSARTMTDLNRTDVVAAMKIWIETIAADRGLAFEPEPRIFDTVEAFSAALNRGEIDIVSAPVDEFLVLERVIPLAGAYTTRQGGGITEVYVVLVHRDSAFQTLADLQGTRLMVLSHPSAGLAPAWLDVELRRRQLSPLAQFFGATTSIPKVNRAILPVFFKQAEACLVTRRGFETAGELNPQVLAQLRVLASSPPLVPGLGAHRADVDPAVAERFRQGTLALTDTPAGRHVLNLFQCDAIVAASAAEIAPTRAFLAEHNQLVAEAAGREGSSP